jgi:hypothetical protein
LDLVTEALSRATPDNSKANLLAEFAPLLPVLDRAAEALIVVLLEREIVWFPQQRRLVLDVCVRLFKQAITINRPLLAARIARAGTDHFRDLAEYLEGRSPHLPSQLQALVEDRPVYGNATWYRKDHERDTVLWLLEHTASRRSSEVVSMLINLSEFPASWRVEWLVCALDSAPSVTDSSTITCSQTTKGE